MKYRIEDTYGVIYFSIVPGTPLLKERINQLLEIYELPTLLISPEEHQSYFSVEVRQTFKVEGTIPNTLALFEKLKGVNVAIFIEQRDGYGNTFLWETGNRSPELDKLCKLYADEVRGNLDRCFEQLEKEGKNGTT